MTEMAHTHSDTHEAHGHHGPPPPVTGWHRFTAPGWLRVLWAMPLVGFLGLGVVCLVRWAAHWDPVWSSTPIVTIALVVFPMGFLIGLGGFDFWAYYSSGKKTQPEDHSGHGARSWRDYFRINTDHKVIGMQYLVTTFAFFLVGGFFALLFRAELAQPGDQYFNPQTYNVLVSDNRH